VFSSNDSTLKIVLGDLIWGILMQRTAATAHACIPTCLDHKGPSCLAPKHELYVCAGSRKKQLEICIQIGKNGPICAVVIQNVQFVLSAPLLVQDYCSIWAGQNFIVKLSIETNKQIQNNSSNIYTEVSAAFDFKKNRWSQLACLYIMNYVNMYMTNTQ